MGAHMSKTGDQVRGLLKEVEEIQVTPGNPDEPKCNYHAQLDRKITICILAQGYLGDAIDTFTNTVNRIYDALEGIRKDYEAKILEATRDTDKHIQEIERYLRDQDKSIQVLKVKSTAWGMLGGVLAALLVGIILFSLERIFG